MVQNAAARPTIEQQTSCRSDVRDPGNFPVLEIEVVLMKTWLLRVEHCSAYLTLVRMSFLWIFTSYLLVICMVHSETAPLFRKCRIAFEWTNDTAKVFDSQATGNDLTARSITVPKAPIPSLVYVTMIKCVFPDASCLNTLV